MRNQLRFSLLLWVLTAMGLGFPVMAGADLSITQPASGAVMGHCHDYFRYEWGSPLNMNGPSSGALNDIPQTHQLGVSGYSYSGGIMSMTTTTGAGIVTLLSYTPVDPIHGNKGAIPIGSRYGEAKPINTSKYRYFNVRMYSPQAAEAQIMWRESVTRWAITTFHVSAGWKTYTIDLASAPVASSSGANIGWTQDHWEGLEFYPVNIAGLTVQIDWIQLLSDDDCGTFNATFTSTSGDDRITMILDTDTNPANGYSDKQTVQRVGSGGSVAFDSHDLMPGTYRVYGMQNNDWATMTHLNPWDFSDSDEITSTLIDISGTTISGGLLSGTVSGVHPQFNLNLRNATIDASVFRYLSIRANYSGAGIGEVFFYTPASGSTPVGSEQFTFVSGWNNYTIDLGGVAGWAGQISRLRISPIAYGGVGTSFQYDFVALRTSGYVATLPAPAYVQAPSTLEVNNLLWAFKQPDHRGGREFSQHVVANTWNMNEIDDIRVVTHVASAEILPHNQLIDPAGVAHTGDFFRAYTITGNGDPQYPVLYFDTERCIDTTRYVNMCFRGWNTTESNGFNSVARFIWHNALADRLTYFDGDDIIMNRSNAEYCLDLRNIRHTETEPPQPGGSPNQWTAISQNGSCADFVRVDMSESTEAGHYSVLDYMHIRTDHEANSAFAIVVDAPLNRAVSLFYNSNASTSGGTPIGTLPVDRNTNVFLWDTSALPDGSYYIYGSMSRAGNDLRYLAGGRVVVNHSLADDAVAPILNCDRPSESQLFDTELELAGYVLDDVRLATVELFIDGDYVKTVTPSLFSLAARDLYPHYAEANRPGFHEVIDIRGLGLGAHTVRLVAMDTAGNVSSCERTIAKSTGATYTPISYPAPDASPISYPLDGLPVPEINVRIQQKVNLAFTLKDVGVCGSARVVGATKLDFSDAVTLLDIAPSAMDVTATARKLPGPAYGVKGTMRFRLYCDDEDRGFKPINIRKLKGPKKSKSAAALLKAVGKKIRLDP